MLHPVFQYWVSEVTSLDTAQTSNLKCYIDFLPLAHPGDLIANNQVTSPLIKWCTKGLSFCLCGRLSVHLDPLLLSSTLMNYRRLLSVTISVPLLSACHIALPVFVACFSDWPQLHSGRSMQMQDDPVISVWLLMLRKTFSNKVLFQFSSSEQTEGALLFTVLLCFFTDVQLHYFLHCIWVLVDIIASLVSTHSEGNNETCYHDSPTKE